VKKVLCVIVAAGFLAGLGCGDSTTGTKKEKDTGKTTTPPPKEKMGGGAGEKKTDK
jgi:hypothetical protein